MWCGPHHRIDHVFLARRPGATATAALRPTDNEKLGLIERAWFTTAELRARTDKLLPASLPALLEALLAGDVPSQPLLLHD